MIHSVVCSIAESTTLPPFSTVQSHWSVPIFRKFDLIQVYLSFILQGGGGVATLLHGGKKHTLSTVGGCPHCRTSTLLTIIGLQIIKRKDKSEFFIQMYCANLKNTQKTYIENQRKMFEGQTLEKCFQSVLILTIWHRFNS
jgi:hypothetical protein